MYRDAPIPLSERRRPSIFAAEALVLLAVAGLWLSSALVGALNPGSGTEFLLDLVYYGGFIALPVAVYALRRRGLSDALRLNPLPIGPTLLVALTALMSVYAASALGSLWAMLLDALGLREPSAALGVGTSQDLMLAIVHTAAIPAVCEELLYRGVVFSALESRGTAWAAVVSSVLFGLMHGNLYGLPAYVLVGAMSAFIVYALDSLYAGMFYHTVYNAGILVILHLLADQPDIEAAQAVDAGAMAASAALNLAMVGGALAMAVIALNARRKLAGIAPMPRDRRPFTRGERAMLMALALALAASMAGVQALSGV